MTLDDVMARFEAGEIKPGAIIRYFFCEAQDGKPWLEMQIEGLQEPVEVGPFRNTDDRQEFFDEILRIVAERGGKTIPVQ